MENPCHLNGNGSVSRIFTVQNSSFSKWKSCRNNNFEMENAFERNCKNGKQMGKTSIKNILEMRIFHFTIGKTWTF